MLDRVAIHVLQYLGYAIEVTLLVALLAHNRWKRQPGLFLFVAAFLGTDGVIRPLVLNFYGLSSPQYRNVYWVSDVILTLGAFLLICFFFRQACVEKEEVWSYLRSMLAAVFVIITFISYFSIAHHYDHLFSRFIVDLQQNFYFACLVLNTLLYIMLQQWDSVDEGLSLLVCGLGIEFAGPAATMALMYLTPGGRAAGFLLTFSAPLCNLGMFLVWLHAVARKEEKAPVVSQQLEYAHVSAYAEAHSRGR